MCFYYDPVVLFNQLLSLPLTSHLLCIMLSLSHRKTFYTFTEKNDLQLVKKPGEIDGQPFELQRLSNCEVLLLDHSETVQADFLESCRVFIAASEESVFLRDCSDCTFTVACKQLRTRDCHNCKIFLHCKTDPIIELSDGITFAPFNGAYPDHARHLASAGLDPCMIECWYKVMRSNLNCCSTVFPLLLSYMMLIM